MDTKYVIVAVKDSAVAQVVDRVLDGYEVRRDRAHAWDHLKDLAKERQQQHGEIDLIILAENLPAEKYRSLSDRARTLLYHEFAICWVHYVVALHDRESGFDDLRPRARCVCAAGGRVDLDRLRETLDHYLTPLSPGPALVLPDDPRDPILEERIRSLDPEGDFEEGKRHLSCLLRDFWEKRKAEFTAYLEPLPQGFSGAQLFVVRREFQQSGIQPDRWVIKIARKTDLWKIQNGVEHWRRIEAAVNPSQYDRHVPDLQKPSKGCDECEWLASSGTSYAAAFHFLGEEVGNFINLEKAYKLHEGRPPALKADFCKADEPLAEGIVRHLIDHLREAWYDWDEQKPGKVQRDEGSRLWAPAAVLPRKVLTPPPYQLPTWRQVLILDRLGQLDELGKRLCGEKPWNKARDTVQKWLLSRPRGPLAKPQRVLLSAVHGDLNARNILLELKQGKIFLIDFDTYQRFGHTQQDFAMLEATVKYSLMDCETPGPLRALDLTAEQLESWCLAEDRLASVQWDSDHDLTATGREVRFIERAGELIRYIRDQARQVYERAFPRVSPDLFLLEYGAALLYHTLRAIGYDTLSPFKRLLAVYSAAKLIDFLR